MTEQKEARQAKRRERYAACRAPERREDTKNTKSYDSRLIKFLLPLPSLSVTRVWTDF